MTTPRHSLTLTPTINPVPAAYDLETSPRRQAVFGYIITLLLYTVGFGLWHVVDVPPEAHLAGVLLAAICLLPMAVWYAEGRRGLPMFELVCLSYGVQFALPLYLQPNAVLIHSQSIGLPVESVVRALLSTALGMGAFVAGYFVMRYGPLAKHLPEIDLRFIPERRTTYLVGAIGFGLAISLLQVAGLLPGVSSSLGAIIRLLPAQLNIAIILLAYEVYAAHGSKPLLSLLLHGLVAISALLGLGTGLLENALLPLLVIFIVHWQVTRRIAWRVLIIGFLIFLLLNPAKESYRVQAWYGGGDYGPVERITLWFDLSGQIIRDTLSGDTGAQAQSIVLRSLGRFDLLHKFAYVQQLTPGQVPFYNGATYSYFFVGLIPRALWPDKPSASDANATIDVDYGLLDPYQTSTTTIAIGHLPEAYANFGLLGIVVVMLLQGFVFAVLDRVLNGPRSEGGRAIYLSFMVLLLNGIGSSAVIVFGSLLQTVLANALILRPFTTGFLTPPEEGAPPAAPSPPGRPLLTGRGRLATLVPPPAGRPSLTGRARATVLPLTRPRR